MNQLKLTIAALASLLCLSALAQEDVLKAKVIRQLKDPDSAQFRNLRVSAGGVARCGEVNAKNSYGGYTGFRAFVADQDGVAWQGDGSTPSEVYQYGNRNTFWPKAKYRGCL